jgi:hypothetical protein
MAHPRPYHELRRPGLEQQHLLSIAVFRRARERQPGSSDPGVGPRIEIFRNLRLACRTSERLHDGHATRGENMVAGRHSGHGRISEASHARYAPRIVHDAVHHGQGTSASFASIRCCATPPPMSWPATTTGPLCLSASRKRSRKDVGPKSRLRCSTSGAAEAGEVDRDWAKAGGGDAVRTGLRYAP